jgi:hypothetical protein
MQIYVNSLQMMYHTQLYGIKKEWNRVRARLRDTNVLP